jgi:hypothetical protein
LLNKKKENAIFNRQKKTMFQSQKGYKELIHIHGRKPIKPEIQANVQISPIISQKNMPKISPNIEANEQSNKDEQQPNEIEFLEPELLTCSPQETNSEDVKKISNNDFFFSLLLLSKALCFRLMIKLTKALMKMQMTIRARTRQMYG